MRAQHKNITREWCIQNCVELDGWKNNNYFKCLRQLKVTTPIKDCSPMRVGVTQNFH